MFALSSCSQTGSAPHLSLFPFPGVEVGKDQEFTIDTRGAGGQGKLDVTVLSPSRKVVPCLVAPVVGQESNTAKFIPREEGLYAIDMTYDGHPVPGCPYTMEASLPPDPTKVSFCFHTRTCPLLSSITPQSRSRLAKTLEHNCVGKVSTRWPRVVLFYIQPEVPWAGGSRPFPRSPPRLGGFGGTCPVPEFYSFIC